MAVFLNEQQFGYATDHIGFPNLLLCMGVVCMANNTLYGVHLDSPNNTAVVIAGFSGWLTNAGVQANQICALYGSANWNERYPGTGNKKSAWKAEMRQIAQAIGYADVARGFDTSILVSDTTNGNANSTRYARPKNKGAYIEYQPDFGKSRCKIFYKKSWKMDYTDTTAVGNARADFTEYSSRNNDFRAQNTFFKTTSAASLSAASSASDLHELNYFLRQISFNV